MNRQRFRSRVVRLLVATFACAGQCVVVADAADREIARLPNADPVRIHDGRILYSSYDAREALYRLTLLRLDGSADVLPIPPSVRPFDADIGPDARGRTTIIWSTCTDARASTGCDLRILLVGDRRARTLSAASTPGASETHPTIWGGRIAFARRRGTATPIVLTRRLPDSAARPSVRLPGIPRRKPCLDRPGSCSVSPYGLADLELRRDDLALGVNYAVNSDGYPGNGSFEVRVVDVRSRSARSIARVDYGEGGQRYLGLSFAGDYLGFARTCNGASACAGQDLVHRYDLRTGTCQSAADQRRVLRGFALLIDGGSLQLDPDNNDPDGPASPSSLLTTGRLNFRGTRSCG